MDSHDFSGRPPDRRARTSAIAGAAALALAVSASAAFAQVRAGQYSFGSAQQCKSSGKLTSDICAHAEANAQAEFDEKAPRFPTREACERAIGRASCSIGISGADGYSGKRSGVYFTPRMGGFRVTVASERNVTVTPQSSASGLTFGSRSALSRDTKINLVAAQRARNAWKTPAGGRAGPGATGGFGLDHPDADGVRGALPPLPPVDPNFDCAAVLEPSGRAGQDGGCYLAPARRR